MAKVVLDPEVLRWRAIAEPQCCSDNPWPSEEDAATPLRVPCQEEIASSDSGASQQQGDELKEGRVLTKWTLRAVHDVV